MKQIGSLLPEDPKAITRESCVQSSPPSSRDEQLVLRVFAYMGAKYGHKWTSLITDDGTLQLMVHCWANDLSSVPGDAIKEALVKCTSEFPEWPPTVGQFKQLCMVGRDPTLIPPARQLEKPRDHALAMDSIEQMKSILGVK